MNGYDHSLRKSVSAPEIHQEEDEEPMTFETVEAEAEYYKLKYQEILETLNETRLELDEFQASSKELEDELERELRMAEDGKKDLEDRISDLEGTVEDWRGKHASLQKMYNSSSESMQREIDNLRAERDKARKAVVDLEQGNDDLERNQRNAMSSLLDLEGKHNRLMEEKILLEEDLAANSTLREDIQRLKDELRDQAEEMEMLRMQTLKAAPDTPPSVLVPLTRPEFMSPVAEASFETSSINTPATFASTPSVAQRQETHRTHAANVSPSTPARSPLAASRRQLDGNGRTASPSSGGIKRSNTIHNFDSPTPLQGSMLARSTNQNLRQGSNIPLGKTVTMKNFQGALGLHASRAASPQGAAGARAAGSPARSGPADSRSGSMLNASTASRSSSNSAPSRKIKLLQETQASLSRMKGMMERASRPKISTGPRPSASPSALQRQIGSSRSDRLTTGQNRTNGSSPARSNRNLPAYVEEDDSVEVVSGSTPPGWTLIQPPPLESAAEDNPDRNELQQQNGGAMESTGSKSLPSRSRIPSALGASVGPRSKFRQQIGRAVSRVSSAGTTVTTSSLSDGNRPETPAPPQEVPTPRIDNVDRPSSSLSNRPPSALSNRPESRSKIRPPLPSAFPRASHGTATRPASAQSQRIDAHTSSAPRSRRALGPADRPRPMSMAGSPSAAPARPTTPSVKRPQSRNELSRSTMSPSRASARQPASTAIPESPSRATQLGESTTTPASALTRSHRRQSLNETPSRLPRRSLSGRPTPGEVARAQAEPAPPVPPLSQEHAALRRTPGVIGLGYPSRPSSRT